MTARWTPGAVRGMDDLDRRTFLGLGAGALTATTLAACSSDSAGSRAAPNRTPTPKGLGKPQDAPFDHVVVLMMENRSFDHSLGWLPGADGQQAGLEYPDLDAKFHKTWDLGTDYQSCTFFDSSFPMVSPRRVPRFRPRSGTASRTPG